MRNQAESDPVSFVVDPSMYGEAYVGPAELYGDLDRLVRTDLFHHYASPTCAQRWLDVCADASYGHEALMRRAAAVLPEISDALTRREGRRGLSVVGLGPGDGALDEMVLRELDRALAVSGYCGLDFSFELLRRSMHRIAGASGLSRRFPIRAVCGDFTGLTDVDALAPGGGEPRVFTLTGFTLGNYPETELVTGIRSLMHPGDYLLLDARLHGFGPLPSAVDDLRAREPATFASYDLPSVRRFVFGPVEMATLASADEVRIDLDLSRSITRVPNGLNLVIHCVGLETRLRLTGEPVARERLDLAVTTMYALPDLTKWLEEQGFEIAWRGNEGSVAFFLLRTG